MPVKTKRPKKKSEQDGLSARLELIKQRHHDLIIRPRQAIAADLSDELGDPFEDDPFENEQVEFAQVAELARY